MDPRRYPRFPIPGVVGIVGGPPGLLLVKRDKPPGKGLWSVPGGGVEIGETQREALVREVKEETGVLVEVLDLVDSADVIEIDLHGRVEYHFVLTCYTARALSTATRPENNEADARWVRPDELDSYEMPQRMRDTIRRHLARVAGLMVPLEAGHGISRC